MLLYIGMTIKSNILALLVLGAIILYFFIKTRQPEKFDFYTSDSEKDDLKKYQYWQAGTKVNPTYRNRDVWQLDTGSYIHMF